MSRILVKLKDLGVEALKLIERRPLSMNRAFGDRHGQWCPKLKCHAWGVEVAGSLIVIDGVESA